MKMPAVVGGLREHNDPQTGFEECISTNPKGEFILARPLNITIASIVHLVETPSNA